MRKLIITFMVSGTLRVFRAGVAGLAIAATPMTGMAQSSTNAPGTQTTAEQGVTVKVTPKALAPSDARWEFTIVLDTHSADLGDDMTQVAVLITNDGRTLKPASWTGAGPGGHHREGVLSFEAPVPRPTAIELKITRPGEAAPRSFRWQP
jgi:hypothetical protein